MSGEASRFHRGSFISMAQSVIKVLVSGLPTPHNKTPVMSLVHKSFLTEYPWKGTRGPGTVAAPRAGSPGALDRGGWDTCFSQNTLLLLLNFIPCAVIVCLSVCFFLKLCKYKKVCLEVCPFICKVRPLGRASENFPFLWDCSGWVEGQCSGIIRGRKQTFPS